MPQRMLQARTLSDRNTSCLILEHDPVCNIDFDPVLLKFLLIWQFCIFFKKWGHRVPQHYTCTESPHLNAPLLALVFFVKWRHRMPQHYSCIDPTSDIKALFSSIRRTPAAVHNAARARSLLASFDAQAATPSTQAIPAFVTIFCFGGLPC